MKCIYTIFIVFILNLPSYSQNTWEWVNPKPQGNYITNTRFLNDNTGFAFGIAATILKTTNSGNSWELLYSKSYKYPERLHTILDLFIYDQNNIFAVGDSSIFIKSTNGGYTWFDCSRNGISADQYFFRSINFRNEMTGIVGTGEFLYKTVNGGASWTPIFNTQYIIDSYVFGDTIYAREGHQSNKIYKSTNFGQSWNVIYNYNTPQGYVSYSIFYNNKIGVIHTYENFSLKTFFTNDGGNYWSEILSSVYIPGFSFLDYNTGFSISENTMYKTSNSGNSWTFNNINPIPERGNNLINFINELTGYRNISNLYYSYSSSIYKTTDGGFNWSNTVSGFRHSVTELQKMSNNNIYGIANFHYSEYPLFYDSTYLIKSTDLGNNWNLSPIPLRGYSRAFYFLDDNTGYVCKKPYIQKTINGGTNWSIVENDSLLIANDIYFLNENTGFVIGNLTSNNGYNYKKTTNGGLTWQNEKLNNLNFNLNRIQFINNTSGFIYCGGRVLKSTNSGLNWVAFIFSYVGSDGHFINENTGYFTSSSSFVITTNGGNNFQTYPIEQGQFFYEQKIHFIDTNNIFYLGLISSPFSSSIYKSTNNGRNWKYVNTGSLLRANNLLFLNPSTGYVYGDDGMIMKTVTGGVNIQNISSNIPEAFTLYQNYPNPFNPSTKIRFDIARSGKVELSVYDITGKKITDLVNEELYVGSYEVIFNAQNLSSGIYFYTLKTSDFISSKKMMLIK